MLTEGCSGIAVKRGWGSVRCSAVLVDSLYQGLLQRSPGPEGFAFWTGRVDAGQPVGALIAGMLASEEYYNRFDNIYEAPPSGAARMLHLHHE